MEEEEEGPSLVLRDLIPVGLLPPIVLHWGLRRDVSLLLTPWVSVEIGKESRRSGHLPLRPPSCIDPTESGLWTRGLDRDGLT